MSKKRQKYLLDDFLCIVHGNAQRECIAEKRVTKLLKEFDDLTLDLRGLRRKRRLSDGWERQPVDRIRWRHMPKSLQCIFHFARFCSRLFNGSVEPPA